MTFRVQFAPEARDQRESLERQIAEAGAPRTAERYVDAIIGFACGRRLFLREAYRVTISTRDSFFGGKLKWLLAPRTNSAPVFVPFCNTLAGDHSLSVYQFETSDICARLALSGPSTGGMRYAQCISLLFLSTL